ncbi:MAG: RcgR family putative quorum lactone hydrolase [Acidobacteriota bacterium]
MASIYARWVGAWEYRLATRDRNRVERPFEWGLDWLGLPENGQNPDARIREFVRGVLADSASFFSYRTPSDYRLEGSHLSFSSPIQTPYDENNTVHAEFFPCARDRGRAVLVLPQWNADQGSHLGLCRLLNRFGLTALRMSLAYHDRRMPAETERADYHVSSNIGRTIHAGRQSVIDARACLDWLESRGYKRLGILGTSLGSCVAFITAAHDARLQVGIMNHVSTYFSDVVWTGLSTRHVRKSFGNHITQDDLRVYWAPISPASYWDRIAARDLNSLLIWARYDTTFLPQFSLDVLKEFRERGFRHEVFTLPCGHYTTGQTPFKFLDGFAMCRFAAKYL